MTSATLPDDVVGVMRTAGGNELPLTTDDALWMARACVGEGQRDTVAVTSCMLRRWAFLADNGTRFESLKVLVVGRPPEGRGYSQPVSEYWKSRGTQARQRRRARIRSLTWSEIPETVRTQVLQLFTGRRALQYPGAVHFADSRTSAEFRRDNPGARVVGGGGNVFLSMPASRSYAEPTFVPGPAAGGSGKAPDPSLVSLTTLALALVLL